MFTFRQSSLLILVILIFDCCVERIFFDIDIGQAGVLVVDGVITNEPGPYTVRLSRPSDIEDAKPLGIPVSAEKVTVFDDAGNSEVLTESSAGVYQTSVTGIQGVVGRSYFIRIETLDGNVYESQPDKMNPPGKIDSLYYEFEMRQPENEPTQYGFRIFVDGTAGEGEDAFVRWKFNGTYIVETKPPYKICESGPCSYCPLPCSGWAYVNGVLREGYVINPRTGLPEYVIGLRCTCCRCWVTENENSPVVSDDQLVVERKYRKVEVAYVPVNFYTFFEKYRVQVVQMSLTASAMSYWKSVRQQKDATGSLFQPLTGKIQTNLSEKDGVSGVRGVFYASAIVKRELYMDQNTAKFEIYVPRDCMRPPREGAMGADCRNGFPGASASLSPPPDWK